MMMMVMMMMLMVVMMMMMLTTTTMTMTMTMMMMIMMMTMMMIKNIRYTRQPACYLTDALPIIRQCIAMHERLRDAKAGLGAKPGDLCKCVSV